MVAFKSGDGGQLVKAPKEVEHMKFIAAGRFLWMNVKDGKIISAAGGRCRVRGDHYKEFPEHVLLDSDRWLMGKKHSFEWRLEGDKWYHIGVLKRETGDMRVYQVWKRVK